MSLEHYIWLHELPLSRREKLELLDAFGDPGRLYEAGSREISERTGSLGKIIDTVAASRDLSKARLILEFCEQNAVGVITVRDAAYPDRLRNIDVPPLLLYAKGNVPSFDTLPVVTIIGTRRCSGESANLAYKLGAELASAGILVVTGMAEGIDAAASRGALSVGARTAALLGGGVDTVYPSSSRDIYDSLTGGRGVVLSEYSPGEKSLAHHFPERNRIMSGLALGVLVIAAPEKSGSLITAGTALDQGRDIFVIPGSVMNPEFAGSNGLIKQGAIPVTAAEDIIAQYYQRYPEMFDPSRVLRVIKPAPRPYNFEPRRREAVAASPISYNKSVKSDTVPPYNNSESERRFASLGDDARKIADAIAAGKTHVDEIAVATGIAAHSVLACLTDMELEGIITALPGKRYNIN